MEGDDAYDESERVAIENFQQVKLDVMLSLEDNEATPEALKELIPRLQSSIRELVELFGDTSQECIKGSNLLQKLKKYITVRMEEIDRAEKKRIREDRAAREAAEEAERIRLAEEAEELRLKEEAEEKIRAYEREKRRRLEEYAASKLFQNQPCAFSMQTGDDLRVQLLASVEFFNYACKDEDFLHLIREFVLDGFCRIYGKQSQHRMWLELIASCTLNAHIPVFVDLDENVQSGLGSASLRLSECIANARTLPTGWALIDSNGLKTHVNHENIKVFKEASERAQKVLLAICSMKIPSPLAERKKGSSEDSETIARKVREESMLSPNCTHPKFLYLVENLSEYPSLEIACMSALALFKEVVNVKRSELSRIVLRSATIALIEVVTRFMCEFERLTIVTTSTAEMETAMKEAGIEYFNTLFKVTGKTNEDDLDIPVELYLQDNDILRIKHTRFCNAVDKYGDLNDEYTTYKNDMVLYVIYFRLLYVLVSAAVAVHFNFRGKASNRTFFESPYRCFGDIRSDDDELFQDLRKIPLNELFEIYHLEVEIFGNSTFTVLASTLCFLSDEIQELIGFHIYPSVVMDLLDVCKKGESLEKVYSCMHSSSVFHYTVLRGCSLRLKDAILHWDGKIYTSDENVVPTWLKLVHEFAKLMNRRVIKDDDYYHKEKVPIKFVNHHILYLNNQWDAVDFVSSSKYSSLYEIFFEYLDGLKLASSSHDLEDLRVHEICIYISNCLEFLEERSYVNIQFTLSKFFEAPSYSSAHEGSISILDSFVLLMNEDWTRDYFKYIHKEFEESIDLIVKFLREGVYDYVIPKALSVLTVVLSGHLPLYQHPSLKGDSGVTRAIHDAQLLFCSNMMRKYEADFHLTILDLAARWIYSVHPVEHFMSTCPNGSCLVTILIRFITCVAYVSEKDISTQLNEAVRSAKYDWPKMEPWHSWLTFFMIIVDDGICGLLMKLQRKYPNDFQREVFDENDPRLIQCDDDVRSASIELLTAFCIGPFHSYDSGGKKPNIHSDFCDYLIKNEYYLRSPVSNCLDVGNDDLKARVFNFVAVLMKHERMHYPDHVLNLQSYMNMFRLAVGYEGIFIQRLYECVDNSCAQIQFYIGPATERHIDNSSSENNDFDESVYEDRTLGETVCESSSVISPPPIPEEPENIVIADCYKEKKAIVLQNSTLMEDPRIRSSIFTNKNWEDLDAYMSCVTSIDTLLKSFDCLMEMCDERTEFLELIAEKYAGFFIHLPCCFSKLHSSTENKGFFRLSEVMSGYHVELVRVSTRTLQVVLKRAPMNRKLAVRAGCIEALMESILQCLELCDTNLTKHLVHTMEQLVLRDVKSWDYLKSVSGIRGLLTLMKAGNCALQISSCSSITSLANNNMAYIEALLETDVLDALNVLLLSGHVSVTFSALGLLKVLSTVKSGRNAIMKNPKYMVNLGNLLNSGDDLTVAQSACEVLNLLGTDTDVELRRSFLNVRKINSTKNCTVEGDTATALKLPPIDIVNRLMEMSTGDVFSKQLEMPPDTKDIKIVNYGLSKEDYIETGLIQSVRALEISSANILGCATDSEESDWPDGAPPLRSTLQNSGVLPQIR